MNKTLIAKSVVKNQFWIVTDGEKKVGNVVADGSGFDVKLNGNVSHFKNTNAIQKQTHIEFEKNQKVSTKKENPFSEYPTTKSVFNSMFDVKRKLHLYTKTEKSKCYHAAGWFVMNQGAGPAVIFCPKYIFVQRYEFSGPYKTELEAKNLINS